MSYSFTKAYRGKRAVSADTVGAELQRLAQTGGVTASRVVEAARPRHAPLHAELEWDNKKAAEAHRLAEARHLIKGIEQVFVTSADPGAPRTIEQVYVHVPARQSHEEGFYVESATLVRNLDQFQLALREALRRLESAEQAVRFLRTLAQTSGSPTAAHLALAFEGYSTVRTALEGLKVS